jgi:hypothetical protein
MAKPNLKLVNQDKEGPSLPCDRHETRHEIAYRIRNGIRREPMVVRER